jgi:hypothetical protein
MLPIHAEHPALCPEGNAAMNDVAPMNLERGNVPWFQRYAEMAPEWVAADSAADLLEQTRSAFFAQEVEKLKEATSCTRTEAEHKVKASPEWYAYNKAMVEARKNANLLKARLAYVKMRDMADQSDNATRRVEMRMMTP